MKKTLAIAALLCAAASGQQDVRQSNIPATDQGSTVVAYDASNNPIYVGVAAANLQAQTLAVTSVSTAAAAVVTSVAHGLVTGNVVEITTAGRVVGTATWIVTNGRWYVTRTGADTFTIPVNSAGFTGTFDGVITTTSARTSAPIWTITKNTFDASNNLTNSQWARCNPGCIWDNRATASAVTGWK